MRSILVIMKQKTRVLLIDALGFLCIIIAPFLGWIPGPGGIPLLIIGLGLLSQNHDWAERLLSSVKERVGRASSSVSEASPAVRWAIDLGSLVLISIAVIIITNVTRDLFQTAAISLIAAGVVLLLTNQNRYQKIWHKLRRKHKL
jgi:hypothetical protein